MGQLVGGRGAAFAARDGPGVHRASTTYVDSTNESVHKRSSATTRRRSWSVDCERSPRCFRAKAPRNDGCSGTVLTFLDRPNDSTNVSLHWRSSSDISSPAARSIFK
jgi:hypothetical protein